MPRRKYGGPFGIDLLNPVERAHPLNRGLVGWWLTLPNLYGGGRLWDLLGRNHGTLGSGPTWVPGRSGFGAINFPTGGANDKVSADGSAAFESGYVTVAVLFRPTSISGTLSVVTYASSGNFGWGVEVKGGQGNFYGFGGGGAYKDRIGNATLTAGNWYHVVGTWDGTTAHLYLNGLPDEGASGGSLSGPFTYSGTRYLTLGYAPFGGSGQPMDVTSLRVWDHAKSAGEVWADYDQSRRGNPDTLRRVRPWSFGIEDAGGAPATTGQHLLLLGVG